MNARRRVAIVTQFKEGTFARDAGIFASGLAAALGDRAARWSLGRTDLFKTRPEESPRAAVYIPSPGRLPWVLWRARELRKRLSADVRHVTVLPAAVREVGVSWWRRPPRYPDPILVMSYRSLLTLTRMSLKGDVISMGVDTAVFRPAEAHVRSLARSRHGIEGGAFVVLWQGETGDVLREFRKECPDVTVALLASRGQAAAANEPGLRVIADNAPRLELLWASDVCVFTGGDGGIELPPLVFESLSAGVPVMTRPAGGLLDFLEDGEDLGYWQTTSDLIESVGRVREARPATRDMSPFGWDRVAERVMKILERASDEELAVPGNG